MQTMTPKNLAILFFTAVMTLGSGAALAASTGSSDSNSADGQSSGTGLDNQSGSAGSKEKLPPNGVDNSKINTSGTDSSSAVPTPGDNNNPSTSADSASGDNPNKDSNASGSASK